MNTWLPAVSPATNLCILFSIPFEVKIIPPCKIRNMDIYIYSNHLGKFAKINFLIIHNDMRVRRSSMSYE